MSARSPPVRWPHTPAPLTPLVVLTLPPLHANPWQDGATGLITAAYSGQAAVVRLLIEHKAEVDAKSQVHLAARAHAVRGVAAYGYISRLFFVQYPAR